MDIHSDKSRGVLMNRRQRMAEAHRKLASKAFNEQLELSTTFTVAAMIIALKELNVELDYDRWVEVFEKVYQGVLIDPLTYIKKAEEVAGGAIEFHFVSE